MLRLPGEGGSPCNNQTVVALTEHKDVAEALNRLAAALEALEFGPDAPVWSSHRDRLAGTIRSYLVPRTEDPNTATTVVLAGPTGSGKSTLMNSLAGRDVSRTGALRPTTRVPVVLAASGTAGRHANVGGVHCEVVTGEGGLVDSMVLVDAPDLDSTATEHRAMAETLIDNADIVVFVTSATRYADDVPWQVLRRAVSRGAPVIHVLNRVGSPAAGAIVDFKSRLSSAGLDHDVVTVPEHHLPEGAQQIPALSVRSLRRRLEDVVADREDFTSHVSGRVLRSTISQISDLVREMTSLSDEIDDLADELAVNMGDRLSGLDLGDMASPLYPRPPSQPSRRAVLRWKKASPRSVEEDPTDAGEKVVDRLVSVIHGDLRRWLAEERPALLQRNVDPTEMIASILPMARSTLDGWVEFVARIALDRDERHLHLGGAVLVESAIIDEVALGGDLLFGDDAPVLVERARRELWGRLEVIYHEAGGMVVETIRRRHGSLDDEELRAALDAANSTLAPAYA